MNPQDLFLDKSAVDWSQLYSRPMFLGHAIAGGLGRMVGMGPRVGRGLVGGMAGGALGGLGGWGGTKIYNALVDDPEHEESARLHRNTLMGAGAGALGLGAAESTGLTNPLYGSLFKELQGDLISQAQKPTAEQESQVRAMLKTHAPGGAEGDPSLDKTRIMMDPSMPGNAKAYALGDTLFMNPNEQREYQQGTYDWEKGRSPGKPDAIPMPEGTDKMEGLSWYPGIAAHESRHTMDVPGSGETMPGYLPEKMYKGLSGALEERAWAESLNKMKKSLGRDVTPEDMRRVLNIGKYGYGEDFDEGTMRQMLARWGSGQKAENISEGLKRRGIRTRDYTGDIAPWAAALGAGGAGAGLGYMAAGEEDLGVNEDNVPWYLQDDKPKDEKDEKDEKDKKSKGKKSKGKKDKKEIKKAAAFWDGFTKTLLSHALQQRARRY